MAPLGMKSLWMMLAAAVLARQASACQVIGKISNVVMLHEAEAIVRAIAVEYASATRDHRVWTTGVPDSKIRFKVIERIRGPQTPELVLPGGLASSDDFNDQRPPYTFVRPGGRGGSCFAELYGSGAQFLLFLKKNKEGEFTVNWYPLGPVNE